MADTQPILILVAGPTASGKTDYAIQLAEYFNTVVLSADSRQIYKEISIGTAKPSQAQLSQVPHYFVNHCSLKDPYNAGQFEKEALSLLDKLYVKNKVAVVAGGSGLYIKALTEGFDDLPEANIDLRSELQRELEIHGVAYLFNKLQLMDPEGSKSIDPQNSHRIMRAIEIITDTGLLLSQLKTKTIIKRPFEIIKIVMDIDRKTVYERINQRVDAMIEEGLLDEVKSVYELRHLNTLKTVGYSELFDYLEEKCTLSEAINKIKQHTRNYAKRQLTWLKGESNLIPHTEFKPEMILK